MAELVLTDEEKAAKSFLDWDDESLGKACRQAMVQIGNANEKTEKWVIVHQAAAALLVHNAINVNAATSKYSFSDFSISDKLHGDWEVVVRQKLSLWQRAKKLVSELIRPVEKFTITNKPQNDGKMKITNVEWSNRKEQ